MFFPGETITHKFFVPFNHNEIVKAIVTYKQNDQIILEKTITSGFQSEEEDKSSFEYSLSQPESLCFQDNSRFTIQLNVYAAGGSRHASYELRGDSGIQYLREVITNE